MKPLFAYVILLAASCTSADAKEKIRHECADTLYQVSTLNRLLEGGYDGRSTYRTVKAHGGFGLGTFDALDGEMVAVGGEFFQIRSDGIAYPVADDMLTPFAAVTFFDADDSFNVDQAMSCDELDEAIKVRFPSEELLYAVKITGEFSSLLTRSVPAQKKPYRPLEEALSDQVVFNFDDIEATLAGFWFPEVLSSVNASGFHFHAITEDAMAGGHVLDCVANNVKVEIDYKDELQIQFSDPGHHSRFPRCRKNVKRSGQ